MVGWWFGRCIIARPLGSGRDYQQALKTVEKAFYDLEVWAFENVDDALEVIRKNMFSKSAQVSMTAAKFIVETLESFAKKHGKNPLPKDFIKTIPEGGKNDDGEEENGENKILNLKFGG